VSRHINTFKYFDVFVSYPFPKCSCPLHFERVDARRRSGRAPGCLGASSRGRATPDHPVAGPWIGAYAHRDWTEGVTYSDDLVLDYREGHRTGAMSSMRHLMRKLSVTINQFKAGEADRRCIRLAWSLATRSGDPVVDMIPYWGTRMPRNATTRVAKGIHGRDDGFGGRRKRHASRCPRRPRHNRRPLRERQFVRLRRCLRPWPARRPLLAALFAESVRLLSFVPESAF
jgi:hypothetical protein